MMDWNRVTLFEGLDDREIALVREKFVRQELPAGTVIFHEGDPGDRLYVVESGGVEIAKRVEDETEKVLAVMGAGDFFGEISLVESNIRSARGATRQPTVLHSLSGADFVAVAERDPRVAYLLVRNLARVLSRRLRETNAQVAELVLWGLESGA